MISFFIADKVYYKDEKLAKGTMICTPFCTLFFKRHKKSAFATTLQRRFSNFISGELGNKNN
jgi:hypothetical protein